MKKDQQEHKLQPEEPEVRLMLREREEPEPQKTKEEQGEPKIQGDELLVLKQETGISVVTPAYEETSQGDPELKTEQIPSPNQEQEGSRNEDSGLRKDEELRQNQRFLLTRDDADGPELKTAPNVTELPQRCVWKEGEVLSDQLLCNEDRNFSLDQKKQEPPQIKEEGEEHCISSDEQQLVWKQETETFMVTPNVGKSHHCEQKPHWDQLFFKNSPEAENQDEKESWNEEPRSDREEDQKQNPQIKDPRDDADGPKLRRPNKALTDEKPVSCQTCGKSFSQKGSLSYHMRTHTGEKPYACDMCGKCFFYSCHLTQHKRTHTGEKPFSCHICGKSYNYRNVLITHLRTHTEMPQCYGRNEEELQRDQQVCDQDRKSSLDQEEPEPLQIKAEEEEHCITQDEERFVTKQEFIAFMVTPDQREPEPSRETLLCQNYPETGYRDQTGGGNEDHGPRRDEEPRQNQRCPQTKGHRDDEGWYPRFTQCTLSQDIPCNPSEKPYSCKMCDKSFSKRCSLLLHMKTHTGQKVHSCQYCGRSFSLSHHLIYHLRTHTGEKPFTCQTCGKSFSQKNTLVNHIRTHTGEKPYPCKTCGKHFRQKSALNVHTRTQHT